MGDYSGLQPSPRIEGAYVYRSPTLDLSNYKRFIVDPIGIHFAPDAKGLAVNPATLKELADYFHTKLTAELSKRYRVVQQPGPGVMQLRIAIIDVKKAEPALNIHPATKLSGLGLGGASVEVEGVDTGNGQRLFAFIHTRPGDRLAVAEGLQQWGHAKQAMGYVSWIPNAVMLAGITVTGSEDIGKGVVAIEGRIRDGGSGEIIGMFADREHPPVSLVDVKALTWWEPAKAIVDTWAEQLVALANRPPGGVVKDAASFELLVW